MADPVTGNGAVKVLPIDPFKEVIDNPGFEISESLHIHPHLPDFGGLYQITKFQVLLLIAATIVAVAMIWLGRKMKDGETPRGKMWNLLETLLFFVRDNIAKPGLGKEADGYVPFLTTMFLFVFVTNLLGAIPFMGSATASIAVTFALALVSFAVIHASGVKEMGAGGYIKSFVPHMHLEGGAGMKIFGMVLTVGMSALEFMTAFIRLAVLAIRLFANMLAGHAALFMLLFFIQFVSRPATDPMGGYLLDPPGWLYYVVTPFSIAMVLALSVLELFIAGLQAFIFTLLTSIFIGLAKHPAH